MLKKEIQCNHCQLQFNKSYMIEELNKKITLYFCCNGCQIVYHILQENNLDSFYTKIGNNKLKPIKNIINSDNLHFDTPSFHKRYIKKDKDIFSINLIIENIHCAACVWLNETVLYKMENILKVDINFTTNRAQISWSGNKLKLSTIIDKINSIGYKVFPYSLTQKNKILKKEKQNYLFRLTIAIFGSFNIMMIDIAKYAGYYSGIDQENLNLIHLAEFIFSTPVLFFSGWIFFKGSYYGLKNKIINMDLLIVLGSILTYLYSIYVLLGGFGHTYFDSVTMIITFILIGKYIEFLAKYKAIKNIENIKSKIILEARVVKNNIKKNIDLYSVKIGDIIEVKKGEEASLDGELTSQKAIFDESLLTGESKPVVKKYLNKIYGGTVNMGETIKYRTTKIFTNSTFNNILKILEESFSSKLNIENFANKISKYFVFTILIVAILTFCSWFLYNNIFEIALINSISVIIIACPCALALATPISSLIGINLAREKGIIFKKSKTMEFLAKSNIVLFDKTGTLTTGKLSVIKWKKKLKPEYLTFLYSLVNISNHPISKTISSYIEKIDNKIFNVELNNIEEIIGEGLKGKYANYNLIGGNRIFLKKNGIEINNIDYLTTFHFAINGVLILSISLNDEVKSGAKDLINYLHFNKVQTIMITGDNEVVADKISQEIGIKKYIANMKPLDKLNFILKLKQNKIDIITMVGDGINDSLILSKADVSISMKNGSDILTNISDIIIMNNSLESLKNSFLISKKVLSTIKQNIFLSLIYNFITIPIAIFGFVIPIFAAISMSLSSLIVIINSMRISKKR